MNYADLLHADLEHADLLIVNGRIFTADADRPWAEAAALRGSRIAWVGVGADAAAWRGPKTEVIDAAGCTVLPGFIDSHFHLLWGSLKLDAMQLDEVADLEGLAATVRGWAAAHPERAWVVGYQLRYAAMPPGLPLDRHFLDQLVPDRPAFLMAYDGHTVWANSAALRRGGALHGADTPEGSEIVMDPATGMATGELREPAAFNRIRDLIPAPDAARKRDLLRAGLARVAAAGITSIHDMESTPEQMDLYGELERAGEMTLRAYVPYSVKPETPLADLRTAAEWRQVYQGSHVRAGAIKLFMDGVLESHTALMVEPYADWPGDRGRALYSGEHFDAIAVEADRLGLQIAVHACGDGAVRRALDGFERAQRINGRRAARHRVEHIEVIHPDDIPRFAQLGVIASMQPLHAPLAVDGSDVWPERAGRERWPLSFAWETLRQAGAHLAYGSDWPVVSMNPLLGIHAGRCRRPWAPGLPDQRQSLANLLLGYTRDAAYVEFQEGMKGQVRPGQLADLVILSADLFATPDEAIPSVRPRMTICGGRIVHRDGL